LRSSSWAGLGGASRPVGVSLLEDKRLRRQASKTYQEPR
jgi:hypothetical protein